MVEQRLAVSIRGRLIILAVAVLVTVGARQCLPELSVLRAELLPVAALAVVAGLAALWSP